MNPDVILRMTGRQKRQLHDHLFPGDGLEAVALLICGRRRGIDRHCLSVIDVVPIPHADCRREQFLLTWSTQLLLQLIQRATANGNAIVKIHSHPGGFDQFSQTDDRSDAEYFSTISAWTENDEPHGSVVMLPCGRMFGRFGIGSGGFCPISLISVAGDTIEYWSHDSDSIVPDFADRHAQLLGGETINGLRRLRCAVIGCSGTGSPTVEQLFRLGIGEMILVDPDVVGVENLNRIINSRGWHAQAKTSKVSVLAQAIEDTELGTSVSIFENDLCSPSVVNAVATCDIIFGCVDSVFARHLLNKITATYNIPFIDIGIGIRADGKGGINHVSGAVHYLQPDGSSLLSRGVFSLEDIQVDILRRTDPSEYESRLGVGYIKGAEVRRPAVMPINTIFSGYGVYEFLCRIHPIRDEGNTNHASQRWSLSNDICLREPDSEKCKVVGRHLGCGDLIPLLGMPELSIEPAEQLVAR